MKLSELTYAHLQSIGLSRAHIHTDCSDGLRLFENKSQFDKAKEDLLAAYGDVNLIITPDADWFDRIKIDDAKWQADYDEFCRQKLEWCNRYGAD
jgi:hypothetical protein